MVKCIFLFFSLSVHLILSVQIYAQALNEIDVTINGRRQVFEVHPQVIDGVTMLPLRHIAEALGLEVGYDPVTNSAMITGDRVIGYSRFNYTATHPINTNLLMINDEIVSTEIQSVMIQGNVFVPVSMINTFTGAIAYQRPDNLNVSIFTSPLGNEIRFTNEELNRVMIEMGELYSEGKVPNNVRIWLIDSIDGRVIVALDDYSEESIAYFKSTVIDSPMIVFHPTAIIPSVKAEPLLIDPEVYGLVNFEVTFVSRDKLIIRMNHNTDYVFFDVRGFGDEMFVIEQLRGDTWYTVPYFYRGGGVSESFWVGKAPDFTEMDIRIEHYFINDPGMYRVRKRLNRIHPDEEFIEWSRQPRRIIYHDIVANFYWDGER